MRIEDGPREGETTYYADGWGEPEAVHSSMLITSVRFKTEFKHDHIDVWNRGGGSGHLVVNAGDGARIAARLLTEFSPEELEMVRGAAAMARSETYEEWHALAKKIERLLK